MNDNKIVIFLNKYIGAIIGIIIGILILSFNALYEVFKCLLVIGVCGWVGHYFVKHKDTLKRMIDKL